MPPLVIQAAFDDEMQYLRSQAEISQTQVINEGTFLVGRLADKEVVLVDGDVTVPAQWDEYQEGSYARQTGQGGNGSGGLSRNMKRSEGAGEEVDQ